MKNFLFQRRNSTLDILCKTISTIRKYILLLVYVSNFDMKKNFTKLNLPRSLNCLIAPHLGIYPRFWSGMRHKVNCLTWVNLSAYTRVISQFLLRLPTCAASGIKLVLASHDSGTDTGFWNIIIASGQRPVY